MGCDRRIRLCIAIIAIEIWIDKERACELIEMGADGSRDASDARIGDGFDKRN